MFFNKKMLFVAPMAFLWLLIFNSQIAIAQEPAITDSIQQAFSTNNVELLTPYLNKTVELKIKKQHGIYNKKHTVFILSEFFESEPTKKFSITNANSQTNNVYIVGKLETNKKPYQVFILVKDMNGTQSIYQISIME